MSGGPGNVSGRTKGYISSTWIVTDCQSEKLGERMGRPKKDPEIRRQQLLDVAEELFNRKGYDETAVSDIVGQMGVAQGTFYYYFGSKDEILDAVITRIIDRAAGTIEEIVERVDLDAAQKVLRFQENSIERRTTHSVLDYMHLERNAKLHYKLQRHWFEMVLPLLSRVVEQGLEDGIFHTDSTEATAAGLILLGGMVEMYDRTPETFGIRPDIIGPLQDQMERILGAKAGALDGFAALWEGLHEPP